MNRLFHAFCALFLTGSVFAQPNSFAERLVQLEQRLFEAERTIGSLRLDMEAVLRENAQLRKEIEARRRTYVTLEQLDTGLNALSQEITKTIAKQQQVTLSEVAGQVEDLAAQTREALKKVATNVGPPPAVAKPVEWGPFPKSGINYTVQSGDSLGKIARQFNSQIPWIQSANRLAGDLIYAGQQLFIPQQD